MQDCEGQSPVQLVIGLDSTDIVAIPIMDLGRPLRETKGWCHTWPIRFPETPETFGKGGFVRVKGRPVRRFAWQFDRL